MAILNNHTIGSLSDFVRNSGNSKLLERSKMFSNYVESMKSRNEMIYHREICSPQDREVLVKDPCTGKIRKMLMFGSNSYLGIANHPHLKERVNDAIGKYGVGLGGPRTLNGSTTLHWELEEKLAKIKGKESSIIFSSGYSANMGIGCSILRNKDIIFIDELIHASFIDGIKFNNTYFRTFRHNDIEHLEELLKQCDQKDSDIYVATESVFSMDGDLGKINEIIALKKHFNFILIVDDAHGLGVIGKNGHGVHEHFNTNEIDIIMGTFSKALAGSGGYVAANNDIVNLMRYFSRSYLFSASMPPILISLILGSLEILESEKWRVKKTKENATQLVSLLNQRGIKAKTESAIIPIKIPGTFNIRKIGKQIHDAGIFLNAVEEPSVPKGQERFRISVMATHTNEDVNTFVSTFSSIISGV